MAVAEEQAGALWTVRVAEGLLRGRQVASRAGGAFWSFNGVPYATPPIGPLRFKDAQPAEPWEGVRDAFEVGSMCTQVDEETLDIVGSEDCLYLNVHTPRRETPEQAPLPVMVYIRGGGFEFGSGHGFSGGPDYLLADGVIVVTINYRLGVLGFLFLESAAPGNVGLKDQVAALRWVQRNIAAFGGDPGNVTLFGTSAGAASVHFHMLSPMSKGLFHRAIAMSGAALNPWARQTEPAATTRTLARLLGCTSDDPRAIVDFLRGVDHNELVRLAHTDARPGKMFSDITINEGITYALKCMTKTAKAPIFQYVFTVDDRFNFLKRWKKIDVPGAAHGDIIGYLFDTIYSDPDTPTNSIAVVTRRRVVRLWTNFAKTGDPTPNNDLLLELQWKPYTAAHHNFLEIGHDLKSGINLHEDRVDFWEKFYTTYGS